jgi:hypothetical protein
MPRFNVDTSSALMDALEEVREQIVIASEPLDGWLEMQEVNPDDPNEVEWQTDVWNNANKVVECVRNALTILGGEKQAEQIIDDFANFEPSVERNPFAVCYRCNCLFDDNDEIVTEGDGQTRHADGHCFPKKTPAIVPHEPMADADMTRWSGEIVVEITDIDRDSYIGVVTTPEGSRQVAASQPSEDPFAEEPADTTPEGIDTAAYLLIDMASESDSDGETENLVSILDEDEPDIRTAYYRAADEKGFTVVARSYEERGKAVAA